MSAPAVTSSPVDVMMVANMATARTVPTSASNAATARANAQDFEAVFLNTMFQHMFTDVDGDGPISGAGGAGVWRSFLTDQYAQAFAKAGGIGLANDVYRSLLAQQEAKAAKIA
jgi:peptidoglycan hydrolase FlgJ